MILALALILAQPLTIRRAQVDISPPEPLPLGGYTERHGKVMDPGGDPLVARCIEFEQGGTKVALVSVEMLTIPESLYREVSARIPKDVHLFMQATHTHCAPDSQMLNDRMTFGIPGIASYRKRWLTWYADRVASCVQKASTARAISPIAVGTNQYTANANRARRKGGQPDPTVTRVWLAPSASSPFSGKKTDLLFGHYTAHPIVYDYKENKTRGDWIGLMARRWGGPILNGAIGDVSPSADGPNTQAKFNDFFRKLDRSNVQVAVQRASLWHATSRGLDFDSEAIGLDPKKPHPAFAKSHGIPEAIAQSLVDQFAPPTANIAAIRLGDLVIVGVPGEPTSILGNQIKAAGEKMGFKTVLVCSHVNGWMGYILDPEDYDRGEYEAELSFYGREEGTKVVEAALKALSKLR